MLISLSKRFVFISNSKTASTSIESVLDQYAEIRERSVGRKHMGWERVRSEYAFLFDHPHHPPERFFRFGVVRDPVQWFVSWYNYRIGAGVESPLPAGTSFEEFWAMDDWVKFRKTGAKNLQRARFSDADGHCRFDLVMPMDMLGEYAQRLFGYLGIDAKLPVKNRSQSRLSAADISPALHDDVRSFWEEDYAFIEEMRARVQTLLCPIRASLHPVDGGILSFFSVEISPKVFAGRPFDVGGVVVLAAGFSQECRLVLRAGTTALPVRWGIPSPVLGQRFSDNPRASHARFLLQKFVLKPGSSAELVLDVPGESPRILATLVAAPRDVCLTPLAG